MHALGSIAPSMCRMFHVRTKYGVNAVVSLLFTEATSHTSFHCIQSANANHIQCTIFSLCRATRSEFELHDGAI